MRTLAAVVLLAACTAKDEGTTSATVPPTGTNPTTGATGTGTGTGSTGSTTTPPSPFDGELFGLRIHFDTWTVDIGRFDTVSGTYTNLGPAPVDPAVSNSQETVLVRDRGLYVVLDRGQVVSFDVATGAVVHDFDLGGPFRGVEYDSTTGLLVGIWAPDVVSDVSYATLDLDTEVLTSVTPFPGAPSMNAQANAIDPAGRRYYVSIYYAVDDDRLATIDLDTGAVLSEIPVGNPLYAGMAWDDPTDRLMAFYLDETTEGFAEIDPATAAVTVLGTDFTSGNSGSLDPDLRRFYIDCGPDGIGHAICWYDLDTGAYVGRLDVEGMEYGYHPL